MEIRVKVPASSANLGAGFDTLGMALSLYLECTLRSSAGGLAVSVSGSEPDGIPADASNLVWRSFQSVAGPAAGDDFALEIHNDIPLGRGLGSSAAAIVAGLVLANELADLNLSRDALLQKATEIEGHPDNVAAAIFGGVVVSCQTDQGDVLAVKSTPASSLQTVVVVPEFQLATGDARSALPETYSRPDAIFNLQRVGLFVATFAGGRFDLLREAMKDRIHQPYRARLVPGLSEILALQDVPGLLGVALSGAGPSVLAFCRPDIDPAPLASAIVDCFRQQGIESRSLRLPMDTEGFIPERLS